MSRLFRIIIAAGFIAGSALSVQAQEPAPRVTGYQTVMVGESRVTALYKGYVTNTGRHEQVAYAYKQLTSNHTTRPATLMPGIAAFVVDTGDKITLVCVDGTEPTPAVRGYLMSSLVAAGYSPEDVDEVRIVDTAETVDLF